METEMMVDLTQKTGLSTGDVIQPTVLHDYEIHPMAELFPPQTPQETDQLRENMIHRVKTGMPPLETPILLVENKIADGRHRYQVWKSLAAEGVCDGYFAKNKPTVEEMKDDPDQLAALMLRVTSRNLCQRSLSAARKAEILLMQIEKFPAFQQHIEKIKDENVQRMKAGKSVEDLAKGQTTNEVLAEMAGVSTTTIKNAKRIKKQSPTTLEDVAKGDTSLSKRLRKDSDPKKVSPSPSRRPMERKTDTQLPQHVDEETRCVVLTVYDANKIAPLSEFFPEYGIRATVEKRDNCTAFQFDGTANDQNNLLTTLGELLNNKGPNQLNITVG